MEGNVNSCISLYAAYIFSQGSLFRLLRKKQGFIVNGSKSILEFQTETDFLSDSWITRTAIFKFRNILAYVVPAKVVPEASE